MGAVEQRAGNPLIVIAKDNHPSMPMVLSELVHHGRREYVYGNQAEGYVLCNKLAAVKGRFPSCEAALREVPEFLKALGVTLLVLSPLLLPGGGM